MYVLRLSQSSSVAVIYVYVRLVNWTTRQRFRRLDRKNPDVSIGRSCFIGIRTETRNWPDSIELLLPFPLRFYDFFFFFRLSRTDSDGGLLCAKELFTIIMLLLGLGIKPLCNCYHINQMSEKFWMLCFFSSIFVKLFYEFLKEK